MLKITANLFEEEKRAKKMVMIHFQKTILIYRECNRNKY